VVVEVEAVNDRVLCRFEFDEEWNAAAEVVAIDINARGRKKSDAVIMIRSNYMY